jgi:hypothetical protein
MVKSPKQEQQKTFSSVVGALWEKKSDKCGEFMSGNINIDGLDRKIVVFRNQYKGKNDTRPDWIINIIASKDEQNNGKK